ncbi:MAG TPA: hypothetical protein VF104_10785, partial [Burkholderiales bacterium]
MDKKSLISRFTQAALMLALAAATGQAFANTGRASQLDNWCAKQPVSANPPQQSRPYRASGSSCATCHPAGGGNNAGNLNPLGSASTSCSGSGTTTTCGTTVNPFCVSTAPTSVSITAPAAGTTLNVGQAATFQGQ